MKMLYTAEEIQRIIHYAWQSRYLAEECINLLRSKGIDDVSLEFVEGVYETLWNRFY